MPSQLLKRSHASSNHQNPNSRPEGLKSLADSEDLVCVDHGLTGPNRERPGQNQSFAGCRAGDSLVITKFGLLTHSVPYPHEIVADLATRSIKISLGVNVNPSV